MLNNRLEDLIYKYKSYRLKQLIKTIFYTIIFFIVFFGLYSIYKKWLDLKRIHNYQQKNELKNISSIPIFLNNITIKPQIIKIDQNKIDQNKIDEDKILNNNSFQTLILVEKNKPTYQTALDLAKYYYKNKNYQKSSKWAFVATNRDPKKDQGWIIYAKSKIKLNQKGIAKKALKIYLLKYHSREVSNLLNSI